MSTLRYTQADRNRRNAFELALAVNENVTGKASFTSNPSKEMVFRMLNRAQTELCNDNEVWTFLNDTISFPGYDFSDPTQTIAATNFSASYADETLLLFTQNTSHYYMAQKIETDITETAIQDVTVTFAELPTAILSASTFITAYICPVDGNGNPDLNNKMGTSTPVNLSVLLDAGFDGKVKCTFSAPVEPVIMPPIPIIQAQKPGSTLPAPVPIPVWVVFDFSIDSTFTAERFMIKANTNTSTTHPDTDTMKYKLDATGSWNDNVNIYAYIEYTLIRRYYAANLFLPSDVSKVQRIFQGSFVLNEMPFDKFQQSPYWQLGVLGAMWFVVYGYMPDGRMKVVIPQGIHSLYWNVDYKKKVKVMVEDNDEPSIPSEYRYLLEIKASLTLHAMGYGSQDAAYLVDLKETYLRGITEMRRDYQPHGERFMRIEGLGYTPQSAEGVKQINNEYQGVQKFGLI